MESRSKIASKWIQSGGGFRPKKQRPATEPARSSLPLPLVLCYVVVSRFYDRTLQNASLERNHLFWNIFLMKEHLLLEWTTPFDRYFSATLVFGNLWSLLFPGNALSKSKSCRKTEKSWVPMAQSRKGYRIANGGIPSSSRDGPR